MKQKVGSSNCVAVVAAMIDGCAVEDVEMDMGGKRGGPYHDIQFIRCMLGRGWAVGFCLEPAGEVDWDKDTQTLDLPVKGQKAYVVVQSETNQERTHAIFWDGETVRDPNPKTKDGRPLSSYDIKKFIPIFRI